MTQHFHAMRTKYLIVNYLLTTEHLNFHNSLLRRLDVFISLAVWGPDELMMLQGAQYIGEICRYLLTQPQSPEDRSHNVEIMWGNGLRPSIWQQFQDRFGVPFIGEFYGATEGNSNVLNIDSKPGSVGFTSVLLPAVYPVSLIRLVL